MTIGTINLGGAPNDNTGDAPRTAGEIINANFTDTANAASKLVGTATGQIPTADDLSMVAASANYTSNNLNPNVFGGIASGDVIALGEANSATGGSFILPISGVGGPVSISITGTFDVIDITGTVTYAAGITDLVLSSVSGNKIAYIFTSSALGMTPGQNIYLRQAAALSRITVNF